MTTPQQDANQARRQEREQRLKDYAIFRGRDYSPAEAGAAVGVTARGTTAKYERDYKLMRQAGTLPPDPLDEPQTSAGQSPRTPVRVETARDAATAPESTRLTGEGSPGRAAPDAPAGPVLPKLSAGAEDASPAGSSGEEVRRCLVCGHAPHPETPAECQWCPEGYCGKPEPMWAPAARAAALEGKRPKPLPRQPQVRPESDYEQEPPSVPSSLPLSQGTPEHPEPLEPPLPDGPPGYRYGLRRALKRVLGRPASARTHRYRALRRLRLDRGADGTAAEGRPGRGEAMPGPGIRTATVMEAVRKAPGGGSG